MIDLFALALSHALLALAAWRLVLRGDLDRDPPEPVAETGDAAGVGARESGAKDSGPTGSGYG